MSFVPADFEHLNTIDPEQVAKWLESTGHYRIQRRIELCETFGGAVEHPVRVMILDTETTGLNVDQAELIEVGALVLEVDRDSGQIGRVLGHYGGLEQPKNPIPAESTAIHGITDAMVAGQHFDDQAFQDLFKGVELIVAHNAAFDRPFIDRRFPWMQQAVWACSFKEIPWAKEGYSGQKLEYLLGECGFFHGAHRAVEDCNALAHVLAVPLKSSHQLPFAILFESANQAMFQIAALKAPFEKKDVLRSKGFRWNSEDRVWEFDAFGFAEGQEIIEWLKTHVYETQEKVTLGFRKRAGAERYANTEIRQQFKAV